MKGESALITARRRNRVGNQLWVLAFEFAEPKTVSYFNDPDNLPDNGMRPELCVYSNDVPERLDFRCAYGMIVHLMGSDAERVKRIAKQIKKFSPSALYVCAGIEFSFFDGTVDENI
jgi:hypothetical protein